MAIVGAEPPVHLQNEVLGGPVQVQGLFGGRPGFHLECGHEILVTQQAQFVRAGIRIGHPKHGPGALRGRDPGLARGRCH